MNDAGMTGARPNTEARPMRLWILPIALVASPLLWSCSGFPRFGPIDHSSQTRSHARGESLSEAAPSTAASIRGEESTRIPFSIENSIDVDGAGFNQGQPSKSDLRSQWNNGRSEPAKTNTVDASRREVPRRWNSAARQVDPEVEFRSNSGSTRDDDSRSGRVSIRRVGDDETQPASQPAIKSPSQGDAPLILQQRRILRDIYQWSAKSRELTLAEDLQLQELIVKAVALYHLEVGPERDYREIVHSGYEKVAEPSKRLRFIMAAFYHELGLERHRDRALETSSTVPRNSDERSRSDLVDENPVVKQLRLADLGIQIVERNKHYLARVPKTLKPKDQIKLVVAASGLNFEKFNSMTERARVKADIVLLSGSGEQIASKSVPSSVVKRDLGVQDPYSLDVWYTLPGRLLTGRYQVELVVTDELVPEGTRSVASTEFEIRR